MIGREQNFKKGEGYLLGPFQLTIFNDLLKRAPLLYGEVQVRT